eukprot:7889114-Alexandrium_andersonii.AAC.1
MQHQSSNWAAAERAVVAPAAQHCIILSLGTLTVVLRALACQRSPSLSRTRSARRPLAVAGPAGVRGSSPH